MPSGIIVLNGITKDVDPKTIWNFRQNHPELVVKDCRREFGLDDKQCDRLRQILMERGVNKWLWARRRFIDLKHRLKEDVRLLQVSDIGERVLRERLISVYSEMQNICKMPRWVEWPRLSHDWRKTDASIVVKRESAEG